MQNISSRDQGALDAPILSQSHKAQGIAPTTVELGKEALPTLSR